MSATPTVVFLDRDGTIIRDASYLSRPEQVELLPGAALAISRLNEIGVPVIVVTNQSGIARGLFSREDYHRIQQRLDDLLAQTRARIDATYYCPDHPDFNGPCNCRKPGTLLFERAAAERALDMSRPAFVGDRWRDIEMFRKLGGVSILIDGPHTPAQDLENAKQQGTMIVTSLAAAVEVLLGEKRA